MDSKDLKLFALGSVFLSGRDRNIMSWVCRLALIKSD